MRMTLRRVGLTAAVFVAASSALSGCGSGGDESKTAACEAFKAANDATEVDMELMSTDIDEVTEVMQAAVDARAKARDLFSKAASEDESWIEVQEAAHLYFGIYPANMTAQEQSDRRTSESTIESACARL